MPLVCSQPDQEETPEPTTNNAQLPGEEVEADSEGARVLVRRARRDQPQENRRKRSSRKRRRASKNDANDAPPAPTPPPAAPDDGPTLASHRLSRRVAPGTADAGKNSTLETRLEMILPITENANIPNGPHVARQIIWALKTHGSATARQLARRTRLKKTAVVQILQSLLAVGLVLQEGQGERARFSAPDV